MPNVLHICTCICVRTSSSALSLGQISGCSNQPFPGSGQGLPYEEVPPARPRDLGVEVWSCQGVVWHDGRPGRWPGIQLWLQGEGKTAPFLASARSFVHGWILTHVCTTTFTFVYMCTFRAGYITLNYALSVQIYMNVVVRSCAQMYTCCSWMHYFMCTVHIHTHMFAVHVLCTEWAHTIHHTHAHMYTYHTPHIHYTHTIHTPYTPHHTHTTHYTHHKYHTYHTYHTLTHTTHITLTHTWTHHTHTHTTHTTHITLTHTWTHHTHTHTTHTTHITHTLLR